MTFKATPIHVPPQAVPVLLLKRFNYIHCGHDGTCLLHVLLGGIGSYVKAGYKKEGVQRA